MIEASSVFDPWCIAQVGLPDRALTLEGMIMLLDASTPLKQAADSLLADTPVRQLRAADLVVVSKTDLIQRGRVAEHAQLALDDLIGEAPRFETAHAGAPHSLCSLVRAERSRRPSTR